MGKGLSFRLQFCLMSTVLTLFFLAFVPVIQAKPPSGYGSRHGPYRYPIRNRYPLRYAKPKPKKYSYYPIEFSLFPPVNIFHAKHKVIAGLSLNIAYGLTTSVYGLEFGVIYNREIENFGGVQIAGGLNRVDGNVVGIQISGVLNRVNGKMVGFQVSGGLNSSTKKHGNTCIGICAAGFVNDHRSVYGLQIAGFANGIYKGGFALQATAGVNYVTRKAAAIQLGLINMVQHNLDGIQIGLMNINNHHSYRIGSRGPYDVYRVTRYSGLTRGLQISAGNIALAVKGVQIAFACNLTMKSMDGVQLGGVFNYGGTFSGVQLGAFNIAKDVKGIQIGAVNIARKLTGIQIGFVNIAYKNALPFMVGINAGF